MDKSINLQVRYRKGNNDSSEFCKSFLSDLKLCLKRFSIDAVVDENQEVNTEGFLFIFLSNADIFDQEYIKQILTFVGSDRVFLVNLDPLKVESGFPLHKFKSYRFWDEIKETGESRFFRRSIKESNALYWEKITDISIEITDRFISAKEEKKGKVYLAQTDSSQVTDRDSLKRDLEELGYEVLPDRLLSQDYNECTDQISHYLKDCKLIIHPIPLVYTKYFSDKRVSVVELQSIQSSSYILSSGKVDKRIIWIPSDFEITDEENQVFVEKIQRDQEHTDKTIVLKVTLEELKKIYRKVLSGESIKSVENGLPDVYVVSDRDSFSLDELNGSISKSGHAIKSNFKGITYPQHLQYLANSEVVVVNYTTDNIPWITMKVNDISKSAGLNLSKPFKKVILVKENNDLNTSQFDKRFSEVHVGSLKNLNLAINNN